MYEYLGEVVEEKEMNRRMQQYKDEGIRHFYFMMLQREEVSRDDMAFLHNPLADSLTRYGSTLMRQKEAVSVASSTTAATRIAR